MPYMDPMGHGSVKHGCIRVSDRETLQIPSHFPLNHDGERVTWEADTGPIPKENKHIVFHLPTCIQFQVQKCELQGGSVTSGVCF